MVCFAGSSKLFKSVATTTISTKHYLIAFFTKKPNQKRLISGNKPDILHRAKGCIILKEKVNKFLEINDLRHVN